LPGLFIHMIFDAPAAALGIAIGCIGCLLAGLGDQTHSIPTGVAWGWDFGNGINRHPVALYESIALAAFAIIHLIQRTRV
jgi:phosphatidylglycerol---prolipoprotein diacylglyceryl transferase